MPASSWSPLHVVDSEIHLTQRLNYYMITFHVKFVCLHAMKAGAPGFPSHHYSSLLQLPLHRGVRLIWKCFLRILKVTAGGSCEGWISGIWKIITSPHSYLLTKMFGSRLLRAGLMKWLGCCTMYGETRVEILTQLCSLGDLEPNLHPRVFVRMQDRGTCHVSQRDLLGGRMGYKSNNNECLII